MLGLGYIKVDPSTYLIHFVNGKVVKEGRGLAFLYYRPSASLVAVPTGSVDVPFIFNELTADFQAVTLQGQLTYRIADPRRVAEQLNFTLAPSAGFQSEGRTYKTDDPEKLGQRLITMTQVLTRPEIERRPLSEALRASEAIMAVVGETLAANPAFQQLGIELKGFAIVAIRPTPEMGRALEAEAREGLQKKADEAISERRNAAVEQERRIKENELLTDFTVQRKRQELEVAQMDASIALERQREAYIEVRGVNERRRADDQAYALAATLDPIAKLDPRVLQVLGAGKADPRVAVAMAFQELASNATKIGQLNLTPDLLTSLIDGPAR